MKIYTVQFGSVIYLSVMTTDETIQRKVTFNSIKPYVCLSATQLLNRYKIQILNVNGNSCLNFITIQLRRYAIILQTAFFTINIVVDSSPKNLAVLVYELHRSNRWQIRACQHQVSTSGLFFLCFTSFGYDHTVTVTPQRTIFSSLIHTQCRTVFVLKVQNIIYLRR